MATPETYYYNSGQVRAKTALSGQTEVRLSVRGLSCGGSPNGLTACWFRTEGEADLDRD